MLLTPGHLKAAEAMGAVSSPSTVSPPSAFKAPKAPKLKGALNPSPGEYRPSFENNAGLAAQSSSANIFSSGAERTMPVTR